MVFADNPDAFGRGRGEVYFFLRKIQKFRKGVFHLRKIGGDLRTFEEDRKVEGVMASVAFLF